MAVGRRLGVDWLVEIEMAANARRRKVHNLADRSLDLIFADLARSVQIDIDRQRLGDADGVRNLDRAAISKAGSNDVLCEVARRIGCGTVDLGRILAGECTATMGGRTTICVDDDLAAGQAGVTVRTTNNELARRVDIPLAIVGDLQVAESLTDIGLDNGTNLLRIPVGIQMLRGENDGHRFGRLAVDVAHGYLALGIGAELCCLTFAALTRGSEQLQDAVGIIDRRRHQIRCFLAGVAEHDALVARTLVTLLIGSVVHALCDIGRLRMQENVDLGGLPVETVLFISDVADRLAGGGLKLGRVNDRMPGSILDDLAVLVLLQQRVGNANLTRDNDAIGRGKRFTSDAHGPRVNARLGRFTINEIHDFIGNTITNLVRMTLGHGLAGEQVIGTHAGFPSKNGLQIF
ncbi:hypothetical protein AT6N2_C2179 [Agrobacterium tumefaciens]|nr:hypothetical protein AT6N2_C2179 [Agrobacterium tumefaciens]